MRQHTLKLQGQYVQMKDSPQNYMETGVLHKFKLAPMVLLLQLLLLFGYR